MSAAARNFDDLCLEAAKQFVQTAIIVDNEAGFGPLQDFEKPRKASKPVKPTVSGQIDEHAENIPSNDKSISLPDDGDDRSHYLDMKRLGDAFLELKIVCGVYRPEPGDEMVESTIKAASTADIIIIDWQLEGSGRGSAKAKEVVRKLLEHDSEQGPRLRLLCIYTGQRDLQGLAKELVNDTDDTQALKGFHSLKQNPSILVGAHTRIVLVNKARTLRPVKGELIAREEELPKLLLEQFSCLATGLIPTTAIAAIATIRHATPRFLTVFDSKLDGTYVGHRAMIPHSEDAETFLRRLIADELDTIIESSGTVSRFAGREAVEQWLNHRVNRGDKFKDKHGRTACADDIAEIVEHISNDPDKHKQSTLTLLNQKFGEKKSVNTELFNEFAQLFYPSDHLDNALYEFSRLSILRRENHSRSGYNPQWLPVLSLGSVLRPIFDNDQGPPGVRADQLLLCVQPRCDSVRIPREGRNFPFLLLSPESKKFQFVIRLDGKDQTFNGPSFLYNTVLFEFAPLSNPKTGVSESKVKAQYRQDRWMFTDKQKRDFEWLADIKDLQAQHAAAQLGSRAASVGYDEHEWLRQKAR